jgi:hypothetical protein
MLERMTTTMPTGQPEPVATMRADRAKLGNAKRFPRQTLLAMLRQRERQAGRVGWVLSATGPQTGGYARHVEVPTCRLIEDPRRYWTRDELIREILDVIHPDVCTYHDEVKPCAACPCRLCNHAQHLGSCTRRITTSSVVGATCGCQAGASE